MQSKHILIHQLSFTLPNNRPLLSELCFAFARQKIGLVGRNGVGKSTLLKLIAKELAATSGSIQVSGNIAYVPQNPSAILGAATLAELMGFNEKLRALQRISAGSIDERDYAILHEDWDVAIRLQQQLAAFGLDTIPFDRVVRDLSGGEVTRLLLCKAFFSNADFLLLDEPTNHLDGDARQHLYHAITTWTKGLIVVSHDRTLLNHMQEIIELSALGMQSYGGNYDHYAEQKKIEVSAAKQLLQTRKELQLKAKKTTQLRRERHEQNEAKGNRAKKAEIQAKGSYDKLAFNAAKGRSEQTNRRIHLQADRKLEQVESQYETVKERIEVVDLIDVSLPETFVPNGKMIIDIDAIDFAYSSSSKAIFDNFSLKIHGPERIALVGANGSGKTTLVKLILGELQPTSGKISRGTDYIRYLDQNLSQLDPEISVLDNFLKLNPGASIQTAHQSLAQFLFKNIAAHKLVKDLSGGERLRALLACVLMAKQPPQLLILDEPTNHLDLQSIENIESALQHYEGAMIVISHDEEFLDRVRILKKVQMF